MIYTVTSKERFQEPIPQISAQGTSMLALSMSLSGRPSAHSLSEFMPLPTPCCRYLSQKSLSALGAVPLFQCWNLL